MYWIMKLPCKKKKRPKVALYSENGEGSWSYNEMQNRCGPNFQSYILYVMLPLRSDCATQKKSSSLGEDT